MWWWCEYCTSVAKIRHSSLIIYWTILIFSIRTSAKTIMLTMTNDQPQPNGRYNTLEIPPFLCMVVTTIVVAVVGIPLKTLLSLMVVDRSTSSSLCHVLYIIDHLMAPHCIVMIMGHCSTIGQYTTRLLKRITNI